MDWIKYRSCKIRFSTPLLDRNTFFLLICNFTSLKLLKFKQLFPSVNMIYKASFIAMSSTREIAGMERGTEEVSVMQIRDRKQITRSWNRSH